MTDHHPRHEVELYRTGDVYEVYVDLPGYERADIDVRWHDGRLHVTAENCEVGETCVVHRDLGVPHAVDGDAISASYHDDVLEIHLPIAGEVDESGRRIELT
ncbi:MAG: Hsp20/alpha crystallin family protein [Haloarculaceae archaeon]